MDAIKIKLNEVEKWVQKGLRLSELKIEYGQPVDVCTVNGLAIETIEAVEKKDYVLQDGDQVVFIQKGVIPPLSELEQMIQARHTPDVYWTLKQKRVLIIGMGGLGSHIAIALARVGVGTIIGVDFDVVEPSNLNRQQFFVRHIGMKKVEAIKELIGEINPFVTFKGMAIKVDRSNIGQLIQDVDVVVEAVDQKETKVLITEEVLVSNKQVILVAASGMAGYFDSNEIVTRRINKRFYVCGDEQHAAKQGCGLMAPRVGIVAGHQANLVVQLLMNPESQS